jgi:hypothetical protein
MRTTPSVIAAVLLVAFGAAGPALADETYRVWGSDRFQSAGGELRAEILYSGRQSLTIRRERNVTVYHCRAEYDRVDQGTRAHAVATFGAETSPDGEQRDLESNDPDFLTVLNQPFNAELDAATLHVLEGISSPIPFRFPSPFDGTSLQGTLRREDRSRAERGVVGVLFHLSGPLRGRAGGRSPAAIDGRITVDGTARYLKTSGLLRDLDATVTISGRATQNDATGVIAVYKRSIRLESPKAAHPTETSSRGTAPPDRRKRATLPPFSRSLRS